MSCSMLRLMLPCCLVLVLGALLAGSAMAQPIYPSPGAVAPMPPLVDPFRAGPIPMRPEQGRFGQPRMRQSRTEAHYLLEIDLNGLSPENVQIRPFGQNLLIRIQTDSRRSRSERFDDGRGFREFRSFSTGTRMRRLPVPPDGDLAGLQREDDEEAVRILIPRQRAATGN